MMSSFHDESTFSYELRTYWSDSQKTPHAKNQVSVPGSFFNQFVTDSSWNYDVIVTYN